MTTTCSAPAAMPGLAVSGRIDLRRAVLTPAERAVASTVLNEPETVAFGTVAGVARRAGVSGATVVRLATKLGYQGFPGLQDAIRQELAPRWHPGPGADRIGTPADDALSLTLAAELADVATTLEGMLAHVNTLITKVTAHLGSSAGVGAEQASPWQ